MAQLGSTASRQTPAWSGWGMVPPPRLPARPMRDVAMITSPVELTATARIGARLGSGRQANSDQAAPATSGRVHTHPVMSPAKRRRSAAYGPRSAMAISRLVARLRGVLAPGRLPPSNQMPLPPLSTTHVSPPSSERSMAAVGWSRLPTAANSVGTDPFGPATGATRMEATPREAKGSAPPRSTLRESHVRPPSSEMKKPWLSPPATSRPEGSSAITVMKPAPWIGPEAKRADGGLGVGA